MEISDDPLYNKVSHSTASNNWPDKISDLQAVLGASLHSHSSPDGSDYLQHEDLHGYQGEQEEVKINSFQEQSR